jgi:selenocysteine lyase/cysteine desulfurase
VDIDRLRPLTRGGTGSRSESELHPELLPDKYESGTPNAVGLAGLTAGVRWLLEHGVEEVSDRERRLTGALLAGLRRAAGVTLYGPLDARRQLPTVSFTIEGLEPGHAGRRLDEEFGILARVGSTAVPPLTGPSGRTPSAA